MEIWAGGGSFTLEIQAGGGLLLQEMQFGGRGVKKVLIGLGLGGFNRM